MQEIKPKPCPVCSGSGKRVVITFTGKVTVPIMQVCPNCSGKGMIK